MNVVCWRWRGNLPIGVEDRYKYGEQQVDSHRASALLLYTDGLTEAMYFSNDGSRKLFGEHRVLHDVERRTAGLQASRSSTIWKHVSVFADGTEQSDDLTMLFLTGTTMENGSYTFAPTDREERDVESGACARSSSLFAASTASAKKRRRT